MPLFSLLTFNCFGVPNPRTPPRLRALAHQLTQSSFDMVCLQEVQWNPYAELLREHCPALPYSAGTPFLYAPEGGLLTFARLPIEQQKFSLYRTRPISDPLTMMDWALHKGVLQTRHAINGLMVVVLNTHLNANYSADWSRNSRYAEVESQQLQELAIMVRAQPPEALVVAVGDFNIPRGSWLYEEFLAESGMCDPLAGDTRPTLRLPRGLPAHLAHPIDFTFLRLPPAQGMHVSSDHIFQQRMALNGKRKEYLSDHHGITLQVQWG
jgi:endonuclease/exonuclease/phosphatase family metal-dependent hydrolase